MKLPWDRIASVRAGQPGEADSGGVGELRGRSRVKIDNLTLDSPRSPVRCWASRWKCPPVTSSRSTSPPPPPHAPGRVGVHDRLGRQRVRRAHATQVHRRLRPPPRPHRPEDPTPRPASSVSPPWPTSIRRTWTGPTSTSPSPTARATWPRRHLNAARPGADLNVSPGQDAGAHGGRGGQRPDPRPAHPRSGRAADRDEVGKQPGQEAKRAQGRQVAALEWL